MRKAKVNLIKEMLKIGSCEVTELRECEGQPYLASIRLFDIDDMANYEHLFSETEQRCAEAFFLREYPKVTIILPTDKAREAFCKALERKYYMIPTPSRDMLTIIVKLTARCNLNCSYCYDSDFRKKLSHISYMSLEDMDRLISMAASYARKVVLILHGGEPTLAGEAYFRHIAEDILPGYPYADFELTMQTNGTLLTDEYISTLKRNNINIGISYNALHEGLRFVKGEEKKVICRMERLRKAGVKFGAIDVITEKSYTDLSAIYDFYKSRNIPVCLNLAFATNDERSSKYRVADASLASYEIEAENYFRYWVKDKDAIRERFASMYISLLLTGQGQCCRHGFSCTEGDWLAINANGSIFPCDGDFPEKYLLGYLEDIDSLHTLFASDAFARYRKERQEKLKTCERCKLLYYCTGGCPENDIMRCGSASKKDDSSCRLFHANLLAAYSAISEVSIEEVNPILRNFVIENNCLLPGEIQAFLDYMKIPQDMLTYTFKRTLADENFEIFRLFNNPRHSERLTKGIYQMRHEAGEEPPDMRLEILKDALKSRHRNVKNEDL